MPKHRLDDMRARRLLPGLSGRVLLGFACMFGVIALWSIATPKYAAPDEPAHAIKAAATARGEFVGQRQFTPSAPNVIVTVPGTIAQGNTPECVMFRPENSAACIGAWKRRNGLDGTVTYVGTYPPLYYLLVGLPSLATWSTRVLFWMRFVSAALSAIFLTAAFVSAARLRHARWAVAGVAVAATPMVIFLGSVVNPSGLEISSAVCLWSSGLALVTRADERYRRSLIVWTAISAATLVQLKGLSPLFLAIIALTLVAVAGFRPFLALVRRRDARVGLAVLALSSLFAVGWILTVGSLKLEPTSRTVGSSEGVWARLKAGLSVGLAVHQMLGIFGWLDTYMPSWCYLVWGVIGVGLVVAVIVRRQLRLAAVIAALALVTVAVPTALVFMVVHKLGVVGQGRDFLPIAVGLPVLAAYAASRNLTARWVRSAAVTIGVATGAVQVAAFVQALHRYRTGVNAPIWVAHAPWSPPLPWLVLIGGFVVGQAVLVWWWTALPRAADRGERLRYENADAPAVVAASPAQFVRPSPRPLEGGS